MTFRLTERLLTTIALRESENKTFRQIGQLIGCGPARAAQLYHDAKRRQKYNDEGERGNPYYGLSVRATNCLTNCNLANREEILSAVQRGLLHPTKKDGYGPLRNYGKKTHDEVCQWLGVPVLEKPRKRCPHCGGLIR